MGLSSRVFAAGGAGGQISAQAEVPGSAPGGRTKASSGLIIWDGGNGGAGAPDIATAGGGGGGGSGSPTTPGFDGFDAFGSTGGAGGFTFDPGGEGGNGGSAPTIPSPNDPEAGNAPGGGGGGGGGSQIFDISVSGFSVSFTAPHVAGSFDSYNHAVGDWRDLVTTEVPEQRLGMSIAISTNPVPSFNPPGSLGNITVAIFSDNIIHLVGSILRFQTVHVTGSLYATDAFGHQSAHQPWDCTITGA
jgi:hypothetical protein